MKANTVGVSTSSTLLIVDLSVMFIKTRDRSVPVANTDPSGDSATDQVLSKLCWPGVNTPTYPKPLGDVAITVGKIKHDSAIKTRIL